MKGRTTIHEDTSSACTHPPASLPDLIEIEKNVTPSIAITSRHVASSEKTFRSAKAQCCRARSQGQPRTFVRWRPPSGARRPPHRSRHRKTRAPACEPGFPRAHGATCPTPPTQISQISRMSPKSSCAPSREPCSATRLWWSTLGIRTSCLLYTSPSPRDATLSRMPSSA